jgi:hypothetical protein
VSAGTLDIKSKADLKDGKAKAHYIGKYGLEAFEKLPLTRQPQVSSDPSVMTGREWFSLKDSQRSKLIAKFDLSERDIAEIVRRK